MAKIIITPKEYMDISQLTQRSMVYIGEEAAGLDSDVFESGLIDILGDTAKGLILADEVIEWDVTFDLLFRVPN